MLSRCGVQGRTGPRTDPRNETFLFDQYCPDRPPICPHFVGRIALATNSEQHQEAGFLPSRSQLPLVPVRYHRVCPSSDTSGAPPPSPSSMAASACQLNIARTAVAQVVDQRQNAAE